MPRTSILLLPGRTTSIFEKSEDVLTQTISHHLLLWKEVGICELHDSVRRKAGTSVSDANLTHRASGKLSIVERYSSASTVTHREEGHKRLEKLSCQAVQ